MLGWKATTFTPNICPTKILKGCECSTLQTLTILSSEQEAKYNPSGANLTSQTCNS